MRIAIASGKGGTGKTTLSTNLASFLAKKQSVVLVDLDVEEPNSGLFIKGEMLHKEDKYKMIPEWNQDTCSLCGQCQDVCNFHAIIKIVDTILVFPELCHSCYACSELCPTGSIPMVPQKMGELKQFVDGDLSFIESRLEIGQEQAVPLIAQTNSYVDKYYPDTDIKLYDSPPGTSCPVIEATRHADFVILITESTPFGLHDLKLAVETMKELGKKFGVVINRYGLGNDDVLHYCEENHIIVLAKINNDRHIAELYSTGQLIYDEVPQFKEALQNIEEFIMDLKSGDES